MSGRSIKLEKKAAQKLKYLFLRSCFLFGMDHSQLKWQSDNEVKVAYTFPFMCIL